MPDILDLGKIKTEQRDFAKQRLWDQFHTPKNLVMALSGEAGELCELFQWLTDDEALALKNAKEPKEKVADELADILYYLVRLSDILDIDLNEAFWRKLKKNAEKYPVEKSKGSAKKYTEFT